MFSPMIMFKVYHANFLCSKVQVLIVPNNSSAYTETIRMSSRDLVVCCSNAALSKQKPPDLASCFIHWYKGHL